MSGYYGFPSLPPPMFSRGEDHVGSLLDSEAAMAQARKLEQWVDLYTPQFFEHTDIQSKVLILIQKEALHLSPHPTPLGLTKFDCELLEDAESEEGDEASADIDSNASLDTTGSMYEDAEE